MAQVVQFKVDGFPELQKRIDAARRIIADLRPMHEQFAADFYKDQKRKFQLKGPGLYVDLSDKYKPRKQKVHGFVYPILFASGRLAASLLSHTADGSVYVNEPQTFIIGTRDRTAEFHQEGTGRMPRRPLFETDPNSALVKRWIRIADTYLKKAMQGAFDGRVSGKGTSKGNG